jgi:hypothetical protein
MSKLKLMSMALCFTASLAVAQAPQPAAKVCEIHTNKPKPGMTQQYEQARQKHMAWHKSQNDTWSWAVWEITTGDHTGEYIVGSCDHEWKDFDGRDKFDAADSANANSTMGPYLAGETMSYYVLRSDISPATSAAAPPPYLQVTHFSVKPEGVPEFIEGVKKITAAVAKVTNPPARSNWYALANGGHGPEFVLVQERKSIGELQAPAKSLDQIVQEAYGDQGAAIIAAVRKAEWGVYTELLHFRADLSYMPPAKP